MEKVIRKISDIINKIFIISGCTCLVVMSCLCLAQVVSRYVFNNSIYWSEEAARFAFLWATMLGFSVAVKYKSNPTIDLFSTKLKGKAKKIHNIYLSVAILIMSVVLFVEAIKYMPTASLQVTTALKIPRHYQVLAIPIACFGNFFHCLNDIMGQTIGNKGEN